MTFLIAISLIICAIICAFITDYGLYKWREYKAIEKSWKELNEKLERTGRKRLDKK